MAGTPVGAWTLDERIGQGGMGTVWLAHRADGTFSGRAAIKLLHLSSVNPAAIGRFRSDCTLLAALSHPDIARLLDAGVTEAGQPYLVMEYVDGVPLDVYAEQRKLTQLQRLELIRQTLEAVTHAHAQLNVHRDLKPSNILVRPNGRVALLDFGIGKQLLQSPTDGQPDVTEYGARALTPLFASPEQLRGDAIGTASDTYSAAVVAYQLLTGAHPPAGGSRTTADIMPTTLESEPRRTSLGDLDTVLRNALKKLPGERCQTAAGFDSTLVWYRAVGASAATRFNPVIESRAQFGVIRSLTSVKRGAEAAPALTRYLVMLRAQKRPVYRDSLILTAFIAAALKDTAAAVVLLEGVMTLESVLVTPPTTRRPWTALSTLTP